jgi:hypothetical protein
VSKCCGFQRSESQVSPEMEHAELRSGLSFRSAAYFHRELLRGFMPVSWVVSWMPYRAPGLAPDFTARLF